jgi:hypothetical protein
MSLNSGEIDPSRRGNVAFSDPLRLPYIWDQEAQESYTAPDFKKNHQRDCSNYLGISPLPTAYQTASNSMGATKKPNGFQKYIKQ